MNDGDDASRTARVVVLAQCDGQRVLFMDPDPAADGQAARPTIEPLDVFARQWSGELILITSRASLAGALARFDFSWFIPSLVKYRRLFSEVLAVSLFLQLFALVSPLFFQVVMDKVLVHHDRQPAVRVAARPARIDTRSTGPAREPAATAPAPVHAGHARRGGARRAHGQPRDRDRRRRAARPGAPATVAARRARRLSHGP